MEPLTLRYELTGEELARAMVLHLTGFRQRARQLRRLGAVGVLCGPLVALAWPGGGLPLAGFLMLFGVLALLHVRIAPTVRALQKIVDDAPALTEPTSVMVHGDGLRFRSATHDEWVSWRRWETVVDTPRGVTLLYRGGHHLEFIPARAFAPDGQQASWVAMAAAGIGPQPAPA